MKLYLKVIAFLVSLILVYGLLVPALVSMKDSGAAVIGFFIAVASPAMLWLFAKNIYQNFKENLNV